MAADFGSVVDRLVRGYDPDRIILFGSHALGRARSDSDIYLLIVKQTDRRPVDRRVEAHTLLVDLRIPVDLQVYTPDELRRLYFLGSPFIEEILETGRVLYMRKATAAWLRETDDECQTAALLLEHERFRGACLHSQQAVERGLKALLLERGIRVPHTHNVVELLSQVREQSWHVTLAPDDAVFLTNVYRGRYPSEEGLLPQGEPTVEDARRAVTAAKAVVSDVHKLLPANEHNEIKSQV